jgi:hypothetical protein
MIAGMFIPTDPEQAEKALIAGTEIVLWRTRPFAPEEEIRLRDMWHAISIQKQMSINECFVAAIPEAITARMQPHEILAMIRDMPEEKRQRFIDDLPPGKRPKPKEDGPA